MCVCIAFIKIPKDYQTFIRSRLRYILPPKRENYNKFINNVNGLWPIEGRLASTIL